MKVEVTYFPISLSMLLCLPPVFTHASTLYSPLVIKEAGEGAWTLTLSFTCAILKSVSSLQTSILFFKYSIVSHTIQTVRSFSWLYVSTAPGSVPRLDFLGVTLIIILFSCAWWSGVYTNYLQALTLTLQTEEHPGPKEKELALYLLLHSPVMVR